MDGCCFLNALGEIKLKYLEEIKLTTFDNNGISMRIAEAGEGPLIVMLHGWPESWFSWRKQFKPLVEAGFHVVAPDMPGFGHSESLASVNEYNAANIARYVVGILDHFNVEQAVLVGHDWGAIIAWHVVRLYPERFSKLINMSVPFIPHTELPPIKIWQNHYGENFFYIVYFQEKDVPEKEFDANPEAIIKRLYCSPNTLRAEKENKNKNKNSGGWIKRLGDPLELPSWLSQDELDYFVDEYKHAGFEGGINYYRNFDKNWELMKPYADINLSIPTLFIAGEKDNVIRNATREQLLKSMGKQVTGLKDVVVIPEMGHWIQQEAPELVNDVMLDFLKD